MNMAMHGTRQARLCQQDIGHTHVEAILVVTGNASAGLTASGGDDTSGGGKKGRFGPGQFANSVDGLSIGRGDKSTKFTVGKPGGLRTFGG